MFCCVGQIGYALCPQVARGGMLGHNQPIILHLLDIAPAQQSLEGVKMELVDAAFPLLKGTIWHLVDISCHQCCILGSYNSLKPTTAIQSTVHCQTAHLIQEQVAISPVIKHFNAQAYATVND